jgi:very-short-patch-repair endonuclease
MYFLERNPNLFNVAITRARAALVVVGDPNSAELARLHYLSDFAAYVEALQGQRSMPQALEPRDFGPSYPEVDGPMASGWEKRLYEALHARGIVTTPQLPVEQYWLDLALLDGQRRLDIEVDGEHYHRAWDGEIARRDQLRNRRMIELGWDLMRFWVYQVRDDLDGCVNRVEEWLSSSR